MKRWDTVLIEVPKENSHILLWQADSKLAQSLAEVINSHAIYRAPKETVNRLFRIFRPSCFVENFGLQHFHKLWYGHLLHAQRLPLVRI